MHHPRGKEMKALTRAMGEVVVKRHLVAMGYDVDTRNTLWAQIANGADIRLAVCVHYHGGDWHGLKLKARTTNPRAFARQRRASLSLSPLPCRAVESNGDGDGAEDSPSYRLGAMYGQPRPAHLIVDVTGDDDGAVPADRTNDLDDDGAVPADLVELTNDLDLEEEEVEDSSEDGDYLPEMDGDLAYASGDECAAPVPSQFATPARNQKGKAQKKVGAQPESPPEVQRRKPGKCAHWCLACPEQLQLLTDVITDHYKPGVCPGAEPANLCWRPSWQSHNGTCMRMQGACVSCGKRFPWESQPVNPSTGNHAGNDLMGAAVALSAVNVENMQDVASLLLLHPPKRKQLADYAFVTVAEQVEKMWARQQQELLEP